LKGSLKKRASGQWGKGGYRPEKERRGRGPFDRLSGRIRGVLVKLC